MTHSVEDPLKINIRFADGRNVSYTPSGKAHGHVRLLEKSDSLSGKGVPNDAPNAGNCGWTAGRRPGRWRGRTGRGHSDDECVPTPESEASAWAGDHDIPLAATAGRFLWRRRTCPAWI